MPKKTHNKKTKLVSDELLAKAVAYSRDSIIITEKSLRKPGPKIVYVNPAFEELTGWKAQEVVGKTPRILQGKKTDKNLLQKLKKDLKESKYFEGEAINYKKDGTEFWMRWHIEPIFNSEGEQTHWLSVQRNITKEKEEEELRKIVVEDAPIGIYFNDLNGRFLYGNKRAQEIIGYSEDELIGKNYLELDLLTLNDYKKAAKNLIKNVKGEATKFQRFSLKKKNGEVAEVEIATKIAQSGGQKIVIGLVRDITDIVLYENILKDNEARYREIINQTGQLVYEYDLSTGKIIWGGAIKEVSGYSVQEYQKFDINDWEDFIHPEDRKKTYEALEKAEKNVTQFSVEYRFRKKNGKYIHVLDNGAFVTNGGKKAQKMYGSMKDITVEKVQREKIKQQEEKFEAIAEYTYDWEVWIGTDASLVWMNPAVEKITGYSIKEMMKADYLTLDFYPAEYIEKAKKIFYESVKTRSEGNDEELQIIRKDGVIVWIAVSWQPIYNDNGDYLGIRYSIRDIDARKKAEEKVSELDQLRNKFIRIVSHQLRTPLNAAKWNTETLLSGDLGELSEGQHEFLKVVYEAESNVINRISDLLTVLDIQEGRIVIEKENISLESILSSVVGDAIQRAEDKGVQLKYTPSKNELPPVHVDPEKIRYVMQELVTNAIDYTKQGGKVKVSLSELNNSIRYTVKDTGIGIPQVEQKRIFDRFYRATNAQTMETDRSGIGLTISKYFIEQFGGRIDFKSTEGKGSTFWVTLPK